MSSPTYSLFMTLFLSQKYGTGLNRTSILNDFTNTGWTVSQGVDHDLLSVTGTSNATLASTSLTPTKPYGLAIRMKAAVPAGGTEYLHVRSRRASRELDPHIFDTKIEKIDFYTFDPTKYFILGISTVNRADINFAELLINGVYVGLDKQELFSSSAAGVIFENEGSGSFSAYVDSFDLLPSFPTDYVLWMKWSSYLKNLLFDPAARGDAGAFIFEKFPAAVFDDLTWPIVTVDFSSVRVLPANLGHPSSIAKYEYLTAQLDITIWNKVGSSPQDSDPVALLKTMGDLVMELLVNAKGQPGLTYQKIEDLSFMTAPRRAAKIVRDAREDTLRLTISTNITHLQKRVI